MPRLSKPAACVGCALYERGDGYVPGEGPPGSPIALVAEAAGKVEALTGRPLVGDAGGILQRLFNLLGWNREAFRLDNCARCFPGDTLVESYEIKKAYKRWYSGRVVTIETRTGGLTGTPNHPVLTPRGWVPLGALQQGDYLVSRSALQGVLRGDPDVDDRPTAFADLFEALTTGRSR